MENEDFTPLDAAILMCKAAGLHPLDSGHIYSPDGPLIVMIAEDPGYIDF